jgi:hypothetical protein
VRNDGEDARRRERDRDWREHHQKQQHEAATGYILADQLIHGADSGQWLIAVHRPDFFAGSALERRPID